MESKSERPEDKVGRRSEEPEIRLDSERATGRSKLIKRRGRIVLVIGILGVIEIDMQSDE